MKVIFLTNNQFPIGMALTNRILSLAKGMKSNNVNVSVICVRPTEPWNNIINTETYGDFEGIDYKYTYTQIRQKSFIKRRLNDFYCALITLISLLKENKKQKVKIIFFGHYPVFEYALTLLCKFKNITVFKEDSEHPSIYFRHNIVGRICKSFYTKVICNLYSGLLLMTNNLIDYYTRIGIKPSMIHKLENCIDLELFNKRKLHVINMLLPENFIAFAGTYNDKKDGILSFLPVFKEVLFIHPGLSLLIIGSGSNEEVSLMNQEIKKLDIKKNVVLAGRLNSEFVPHILTKAVALVSNRPSSLQADYGFPTKLIEYLASSKPVITTITGELSSILRNNENVYEIKFGDVISSSKIISSLLENYESAIKIGKNGYKLVENKFNSKVIAYQLVTILTHLK